MTFSPSILAMFEQLCRLSSVTEAENRVYHWLLEKCWGRMDAESKNAMRDKTDHEQRLEASFDAAGQLTIDWTGDPSSQRRTVMIAHTDCEGYVLFKENARWEPDHVVLNGRQVTGFVIDRFREGTRLDVVCGRGMKTTLFKGSLVRVNELLDGTQADAVATICVTFQGDIERELLSGCLGEELGTVTAIPTFDVMSSDGKEDLVASYIDNAAGVSVVTAVLMEIVSSRTPVNASIIYSRGEEAGFSGLMDLIAGNQFMMPAKRSDLLMVVVDSSNVQKSLRVAVDDWPPPNLAPSRSLADVGSQNHRRCPDSCAAVRLGDSTSYFDPHVGRMLYQSALEARTAFRSGSIRRRGSSNAEATSNLRLDVDPRLLGVSGLFSGGECEASILCHIAEMAAAFGYSWRTAPLLVGSIAIPITNYRAIEDTVAVALRENGHHQPEHTRIGAINSAFLILRKACELHMNYYYPHAGDVHGVGFRDNPSFTDGPRTRAEFIAEYVCLKQNEPSSAGSATRRWIREEGERLARAIGVRT